MENAAKAILIAGGVMISVAVISVALYFYTSAKSFANASQDVLSASQIQSFNKFYTAYLNTNINVVDALNILNRAQEDEVAVEEGNSKITQDATTKAYIVTASQQYLQPVNDYRIEYNHEGKVEKVIIGE